MLKYAQKAVQAALRPLGLEIKRADLAQYPEATARERDLVAKYIGVTMSTPFRQWTLLKALEYVETNKIAGDIVECGVWRGGNMLLAKDYLTSSRRFWLYDTFAGMSEPTEADVSIDGRSATTVHAAKARADHNDWAFASFEDVESNFRRNGLLDDKVIFRRGKVEDTLSENPLPDQIAVLRLDTDWYESTLIELQVLYPRLQPGGVLIIDDYGSWLGAKKATDEYFAGKPPLLFPVDRFCRMAVKTG